MSNPVTPKFYCQTCEASHPVPPAPMRSEKRFGHVGNWGDIVCAVCETPIMTLKVPAPGVYALKKIPRSKASPPDATKSPHWHCPVSKDLEPIGIEEMLPDIIVPQNGIWGDIVCMECFSILTAVKVNEPGSYAFIKVAELPDHEPLPGRKKTAGRKQKQSPRALPR